jgi:hypothetical protein
MPAVRAPERASEPRPARARRRCKVDVRLLGSRIVAQLDESTHVPRPAPRCPAAHCTVRVTSTMLWTRAGPRGARASRPPLRTKRAPLTAKETNKSADRPGNKWFHR